MIANLINQIVFLEKDWMSGFLCIPVKVGTCTHTQIHKYYFVCHLRQITIKLVCNVIGNTHIHKYYFLCNLRQITINEHNYNLTKYALF